MVSLRHASPPPSHADDLDGSSTINSSEQLKQVCTNLAVKLDLPLDVADIDRIVHSAGPFVDDPFEGDERPGDRNEWYLDDFIKWFMPGFEVRRDWIPGDESDEDQLHQHCTSTAPALHHHCTTTAPPLHHHCPIPHRTHWISLHNNKKNIMTTTSTIVLVPCGVMQVSPSIILTPPDNSVWR